MSGQLDERMAVEWMNGCMDNCMDGQLDERIDSLMNG